METRSVVVFGLFALYFVLTFGVRTWLQKKATGSTGFRGISGRFGSLEWIGGVMFVLAMIFLAAAPLVQLAGSGEALTRPTILTDVLGTSAVLSGVAGTWWAQSAMGASWRIGVREGERTMLVRSGPFNRVRNPVFSFMILAAFGFVLLLPTWVAIVGAAALILAVQLQVRWVEEPYLRRVHGEEYARYARDVGRFVPGIGRG